MDESLASHASRDEIARNSVFLFSMYPQLDRLEIHASAVTCELIGARADSLQMITDDFFRTTECRHLEIVDSVADVMRLVMVQERLILSTWSQMKARIEVG